MSATAMDAAVDDFLADPTASTLEGAKRAWLIARDDYREVPVAFADGETDSLRHTKYQFLNLAFGAMHPETLVSPRAASAIVGMGLLEVIPGTDILASADPDDADGDGIFGRANLVWNERNASQALGRFGWKANQPEHNAKDGQRRGFHLLSGCGTNYIPDASNIPGSAIQSRGCSGITHCLTA